MYSLDYLLVKLHHLESLRIYLKIYNIYSHNDYLIKTHDIKI